MRFWFTNLKSRVQFSCCTIHGNPRATVPFLFTHDLCKSKAWDSDLRRIRSSREVVQLGPGVVPQMTAGTWVVAVWGCYFFSLYKQGFPSFRKRISLSHSSSSSPTNDTFFFLPPSFTFSLSLSSLTLFELLLYFWVSLGITLLRVTC